MLIAAAIRLASPPAAALSRSSLRSIHPSCALLLFVSRGVYMYICARTHIHTYIYTRNYAAVPNLPSQPILQRLLESRACMLMIARRGLYLFHLICAPSGHGSCNDDGGRRHVKGSLRRARKRLPVFLYEIFCLSRYTAKYIRRIARLCICPRNEGGKWREGEREKGKREGKM